MKRPWIAPDPGSRHDGLNLVEITRKKARQSLYQVQFDPCDVCGGSGYLYSAETVVLQIIRACAIWQRLISFAATSSSKLTLTSWHS